MAASNQQHFSSRLGLILSVLGIAVGTGNIWRFPRIVANNAGDGGGGAFIVAWIVFLLTWSIPLIIAEYAIGRAARKSPVGAFGIIAGRSYGWMGGFVAFVATAVMFYYSVVTGWCFYYLAQVITNPLPFSTEAATGVWNSYQGGNGPLFTHGLAMLIGGVVVLRGVSSIEKANKFLVPSLLIVVLISVVRALTLPGAGAGLSYLFTPDWSVIVEPRVWLEALTQNAWDTGAGWGLILVYATYMRREDHVVRNAVLTGVGNNLVSLLAATMIFSTVFSILGGTMSDAEVLGVMRASGPASTGLTFIWMPQLFHEMAFGRLFAILFFLGLSFAALSSLLSMIELASRVLVDMAIPRAVAVAIVATTGFLFGAPSALNLDVLGNQDFVWGVALMISGAFIALAVIKHGVRRFREAHVASPGDLSVGRVWDVLIGIVVPVQAVVLLIWWMSLATTTDFTSRWYDPFEPYSLMSCLVQWGIVLVALFALNRWMMRRTLGPEVL